MADDLPDAPWITSGGAELPGAPWVKAPAPAMTPPALSGDMPIPSSPDAGAAYEQARDRWKATVERAKAQQPSHGDFLHPVKPTGTGWGAVGERVMQYPGLVAGTVIDAVKDAVTLPGEVYQGKVDPYSPEARQRILDATTVMSPAGEFAGTGAQIARRAAMPPPTGITTPTGQVIATTWHPPVPNPDYIAPSPRLQAAQTAAAMGAPLPAGLVSENPIVRATTQASRSLPFVGANLDKRVGETIGKAGETVGNVAEDLSGGGIPDRAAAGAQVRPSLERVIADNKGKIDDAYQSLRSVIDPDAVSPVPQTAVTLKRIMGERMAAGMKNPASGLEDVINLTNNGASFNGLQRARNAVGEMTSGAGAKPEPHRGFIPADFDRLYGAMSADMGRTVRANATVPPDQAAAALQAADQTANSLIAHNKNVQRLIGSGTAASPGRPDENIVGGIINAASGKSGNARLLAQLPKDTLEQVGSVVLSEMGHNPATDKFSLEKFGTAYRKLSDAGKSALFPDAAHRKALDGLANMDTVLKESDKYINKSQSGPIVLLGKVVAGGAAAATAIATGNVPELFSILSAGAGGYGLAKYLGRPATASALRKWATVAQDQATGRYGTGKAALALAGRNLLTNLRDVPEFNAD